MAFSTQKDFMHLSFLNERLEPICPRMDGVKLKTYASTPDERAWSMNKDMQARYLIDLVECRMHSRGDNVAENHVRKKRSAVPKNSFDISSFPTRSDSKEQSSSHDVYKKLSDVSVRSAHYFPLDSLTPSIGDDSLLHAALEEMTRLEVILIEKDDPKSRLELSKEKLQILKNERQTIDAILGDRHYPEMSSEMERIIRRLTCLDKIDKNEENELLKILDDLDNREKAYKLLQAQNSNLKRLVEKLSIRSRLESIPVKPEKSTDVNYLQSKIDNLRKEVSLLRSFENSHLKKETISRGSQGEPSDKDVENLAKIVAERNALREKCQHFATYEEKILQWKHDAEEFDCFRNEACCALRRKDEELDDLRDKIDELQYELKNIYKCLKIKKEEEETFCTSYDCLQEENRRLRQKLCKANCDLKDFKKINDQIKYLNTELCEKNCIIEQYNMQFQQLMGVIEDLQKKNALEIRSLQDVDSQTQVEHIDELAATTRATLDQISKEIESRQSLEVDLDQSKAELELVRRKSDESVARANSESAAKDLENQKLQETLQKTNLAIKKSLEQHGQKPKPNEMCEAQVERLNELIARMESEKELNLRLQSKNEELNKALKDCQNKLQAQDKQLIDLGRKTDSLMSDLGASKADLKEVGKLVRNINDVQDRNESLKSVLEAVDYTNESQKEIYSLKKELEQEKKRCYDAHKIEVDNLKRELEYEKKRCNDIHEQNRQLQISLEQANKDALTANRKQVSINRNANHIIKTIQEDESEGSALKNDSQLKTSNEKNTNPDISSQSNRTADRKKAVNSEEKDVDQTGLAGYTVEKPNRQQITTDKAYTSSSKVVSTLGGESNSDTPGAIGPKKKSARKLSQIQKAYEREIDGHRMSNEILRKSLTKLTRKIQSKTAIDFEREFRAILDDFIQDICRWRCEKTFRPFTKLQEICKKILEIGIECLTHKELVYLHQQTSEATLRLKGKCLSSRDLRAEAKCSKCSGNICSLPVIPTENEKILLERLAILERDIESARENFRKVVEDQDACSTESDQMSQETLRPNPFRLNSGARYIADRGNSSRLRFVAREDFEVPTRET